MNIWLQDNFLTDDEIGLIEDEINKLPWFFSSYSFANLELPKFWIKKIQDTYSSSILKKRLEKGFNLKVIVDRAYVNGQSHSQSGYWHVDVKEYYHNTYTLVYFLNEWPAEYGGHLMIKTENDVVSFLPKKNRAVIFHSYLLHMGLEPSCFCKTQRESIALKFRLES